MPVFLFALSQHPAAPVENACISFLILHLLIYPSSNGYNSHQDRDEGSIGGLKHPPQVTENLFYATLLLDISGVLLGWIISLEFSAAVLIYVLISRAYSYRKLRLKKFALVGFLTVFLFQGAFTYLMVTTALDPQFSFSNFLTRNNVICMSVASLFIGSVYPLTQIYQHEADKKDGVTTISFMLGYMGTFIFSSVMFGMATGLLYYYFDAKDQLINVVVFLILMLPVVIRLLAWFVKVKKDHSQANFENTMGMNLMASTCMNIYFITLILNSSFHWF